jgi:hypothetical protein
MTKSRRIEAAEITGISAYHQRYAATKAQTRIKKDKINGKHQHTLLYTVYICGIFFSSF